MDGLLNERLVLDRAEPSRNASEQPDEQRPAPQGEADPRFRLDPDQLPKRLDLTLDAELLARLEERAARSGRCVEELIVELLARYHPEA
ncbi:ribbon-helix-helix domain-containing protein [Synechococcus sp. FGCU-3]|nr:ribbon-helix-helix domain-containing protein [Synechococcus sp. FGCU3]